MSRLIFLSDEEMLRMFKNGCSPSAADEYECIDNSRIIKEIIADCLLKQGKAVVQHIFFEGYKQEETAGIMVIAQPTVSKYLKRALCKLRVKFNKCHI
ncbi:MAG: hypothetical protein ACI4I1_06445 [Oscillospiraceae bacterium]